MTAWRERPRAAGALAVTGVAIVDVAMLVGVALAGDATAPRRAAADHHLRNVKGKRTT